MNRFISSRILACVFLSFSLLAVCLAQSSPKPPASDIADGVTWIEKSVNDYLTEHGVQPVKDDSRLLLDQYKLHFLLLFDTSQSSASKNYSEYYAGVAKEFLQHRKVAQKDSQDVGHFTTYAYQLDLYSDANTTAANLAHPNFDKSVSDFGASITLPVDQIDTRTDGSPYLGGKNHSGSRKAAIDSLIGKVTDPIIVIQFASTLSNESGKKNEVVPKEEGSVGGLPPGYSRLKNQRIMPLAGDVKAYTWLFGPETMSNLVPTTPKVEVPPVVDTKPKPVEPTTPEKKPEPKPVPTDPTSSTDLVLPIAIGAGVLVVVAVLFWYLTRKVTLSIDSLPQGHVTSSGATSIFISSGTDETDATRLTLPRNSCTGFPAGANIANLKFDPLSGTVKLTCSGGFTISEGDGGTTKPSINLRKNDIKTLTFHQEQYELKSREITIGVA